MVEHHSILERIKSFAGIQGIRQAVVTSAGSALGATLFFVFLRALFTPIRMKVVTSLLSPDVYGAVTLLSMTAFAIAPIVSLGGFETLLRRLPPASDEVRKHIFGSILISSSLCGLIAVCIIGVLWNRMSPFVEMSAYISPWAAGLLIWMFLHIQQRMYWFLGCRRHWMARITQLLWSDLWFLALLLLIPFQVLNAEGVVWVWSGWLLFISLLTWRSVPMIRSFVQARSMSPPPKGLWMAGLPLLPVILGEWIFRLSGHYVLLSYTSATEMAFYALSLNVALVGLIAAIPLVDICIVDLSHLSSIHEQDDKQSIGENARRQVSHCLRHLFAVLMPAFLLMVFMPAEIIRLLTSDAFLPAARYVPFAAVMPALLACNLLLARILMLLGQKTMVIFGALGSACLAIVLCLILVPMYAIHGALLGIILSCAIIDGIFALKVKIWRWLDSREMGIYSFLLSAVVLLGTVWGISRLPVGGLSRLLLAGIISLVVILLFRMLRPSDFLHHANQGSE
jgi:O-antigen/teichoic acid export membrane protein